MSEECPTATRLFLEQGYEHLRTRAFEAAIDTFTVSTLIDPQAADAYYGRGIAYFELEDWKAAESDFQRAGNLDTEAPENWIGLSMSLAMQDRIYPALHTLERYLRKHPDCVRAYIQLALFYIELGILSRGRKYFRAALAHQPTSAERRFIEARLKEHAQEHSH